jgi:hypothetical protein
MGQAHKAQPEFEGDEILRGKSGKPFGAAEMKVELVTLYRRGLDIFLCTFFTVSAHWS